MLSSIFVDRPRLAIVIAIVTTIAGALALYSIPIAQYPDIVPPQVSVTTTFPGASAAVVDTTIAQPIEAQVVGVDKLIYMKSVSGDDGSYTLTASFELGTDPDINTVNVNNRVQIALAEPAGGRSTPGRDRQEEIVGLARRHCRLFAQAYARSAVHLELRHDQSARPDQEHARRRRCNALGSAGLLHARLAADRPADRARADHRRHHQCDQIPEHSGRRRTRRRPADCRRAATAAQHPDPGPAELGRRVREHRRPHEPRWIGAAAERRRAGGIGRRQSRSRNALEWGAGVGGGDLPDAGGQCDRHVESRARQDRRAAKPVPR